MTQSISATYCHQRDGDLGKDHLAYVDALGAMAKLDPPEIYARYIPASFVTAMVNAVWRLEGWRLPYDTPREVEAEMRRWGLIDIREPLLNVYATRVRRAILDGKD